MVNGLAPPEVLIISGVKRPFLPQALSLHIYFSACCVDYTISCSNRLFLLITGIFINETDFHHQLIIDSLDHSTIIAGVSGFCLVVRKTMS